MSILSEHTHNMRWVPFQFNAKLPSYGYYTLFVCAPCIRTVATQGLYWEIAIEALGGQVTGRQGKGWGGSEDERSEAEFVAIIYIQYINPLTLHTCRHTTDDKSSVVCLTIILERLHSCTRYTDGISPVPPVQFAKSGVVLVRQQ